MSITAAGEFQTSNLTTIRSVIDRVLWTAGATEQNRALLANAIAEELAANCQIGGIITDVVAAPEVTVNKELLALLIESQDSIGGGWRARRDAAVSKAQATPSEIEAAIELPESATEAVLKDRATLKEQTK